MRRKQKAKFIVPFDVDRKTGELRTRGFKTLEKGLKFARKKTMDFMFIHGEKYKARVDVNTGEVVNFVSANA